MNNIPYTKDIDDFIYLLSCALNSYAPDLERVNGMNLDYVYQLASLHSLVAMVAFALDQVINLPTKYEKKKKKAIRKIALFDIERSNIYDQLSKEKIWHMSLKGIILKDYYPKFRTMHKLPSRNT